MMDNSDQAGDSVHDEDRDSLEEVCIEENDTLLNSIKKTPKFIISIFFFSVRRK